MVCRQRKEQVMSRRVVLSVLAVLLATAFACQFNEPPPPGSDSGQTYNARCCGIPVDTNVYTITGEVVADVETLQRRIAPAQFGYTEYGGTFFSPQFGGKGFVRLLVHSVTPRTTLAQPDRIVLIKTSDTKASALLPKDIVTFLCRAQYEAVAPVLINEDFDAEKARIVETWELDYCRMETPVVSVSPQP